MNFRLTTLLWFFALVAASHALLKWGGLLIIFGVSLFWAAVVQRGSLSWVDWGVVGGILLILIAMLLPPVEMAREAVRAQQCSNQLRQVAHSIINYHSSNECLPPTDAVQGKKSDRHSWRMLTLPYLESSPLFSQYSFDEPWNGPSNRKLIDIERHCCPSHSQLGETSYTAVVGPQTAWGDGNKRTLDDITDGLEQTILLIDVGRSGINWKEPKDLSFDNAVKLLSSNLSGQSTEGHFAKGGWLHKPFRYRNVIMADQRCYKLRAPIPHDLAAALLTANGGETVDLEALENLGTPDLDFAKITGTIVLALVVLIPAWPAARRKIFPRATHKAATGGRGAEGDARQPAST